jgi:hypothetical protein
MADPRDLPEDDDATPVERILTRDLDELDGLGRPLSRRARHAQRSVEAYLKAGGRPQWMERVMEVDRRIAAERRRFESAYRRMRDECEPDARRFAERWRAHAHGASYDEDLNELIAQHNEWYPIERDLPMDLRTRDYVLVNGRSYRRPQLGPEWVLEEFPPRLRRES